MFETTSEGVNDEAASDPEGSDGGGEELVVSLSVTDQPELRGFQQRKRREPAIDERKRGGDCDSRGRERDDDDD